MTEPADHTPEASASPEDADASGRGLTRRGLLGLAGAAGVSRFLGALLFQVKPLDPATYGATAVILVAAAAMASYLPARRAAKVDPIEALRSE